MNMATILDIILLVVLLGFIITGLKAGLVRSLLGLVGYLFAIVASVALANRFSGLIGAWLFHGRTDNVLQIALTKIAATVIFFALLQLLLRMIIGAVDTVFRLPVLHQVNALLGGVFGLLKGILVIFLFCAVLQLALPLLVQKYPEFTQKEIAQSCIYQFTNANNPICSLYETEI